MKKLVLITVLIFLLSASAAYAGTLESTIDLPAVKADGTGVLTSLDVEVIPGKGRILLTISPLTGIQTQNSEVTAVRIAEKYTDFDFSQYDVIFTINAGETEVVEGPSAGAAMAVAVIAAVEMKDIRKDTSITGTIQVDGSIGQVGGILEKAKAAAAGGDTVFLIPQGESMQPVLVEKIEEPAPGWTIRRIATEYVDISETLEQEHGIKLIEVETIKDAVDILLNGHEITEDPEVEDIISGIQVQLESRLTTPMQVMADNEIENAEILRGEAKGKLANPKLDSSKSRMLQNLFNTADQQISSAKIAREKGYLYGAANYAFRAGISLKYVRDLAEYYTLDERMQISFVGDRITEATGKLKSTRRMVLAGEGLIADNSAYEWAIAAFQRLSQAELELDEKRETSEGILHSLATSEGWAMIAQNFISIAEDIATGDILDISSFENKSRDEIGRAEAELGQFDVEERYGAEWYLNVARKELEEEWFVPAFADASIASMRLETITEINTRGWSDLVSHIGNELDEVNVEESAWGKLYRDYGRLVLHEASTELDVSKLTEAMIYARQAKLYSELSSDYSALPKAKFGRYAWIYEKSIYIISGMLVIVIIMSFMSKNLHKSFKKGRKK